MPRTDGRRYRGVRAVCIQFKEVFMNWAVVGVLQVLGVTFVINLILYGIFKLTSKKEK
jgi:hypothetical protein